MVYVVLSFCAVFLLVASAGMLLFYRETMMQRIQEVIHPKQEKNKSIIEAIQESKSSVVSVVERFENMLPKSEAEMSVIRQRLTMAGYREDSAQKLFYGSKVILPLLLCAIATATGLSHLSPFFVYATCLGGGFLIPDFWLGKIIKKRQMKIRRGLPDVLDLMVVCVEAGLSLDQATIRTAEDLERAQPDLCSELGVVVLEQRAGRPRSEAWKNLGERTGEESVKSLVSMLVQAEQLGTSVAKTLRVQSDTLRVKRIQQVEEMAAKTSVKLVFPLVFFIFPSLFLVVLGPAGILMMESFKTILNK